MARVDTIGNLDKEQAKRFYSLLSADGAGVGARSGEFGQMEEERRPGPAESYMAPPDRLDKLG